VREAADEREVVDERETRGAGGGLRMGRRRMREDDRETEREVRKPIGPRLNLLGFGLFSRGG
jgi:hypothetical protein